MQIITERVQTSVLANGLRIVTESMPHIATAALGVWVSAGARYEHESEHGLSHLLEHMAFKGTVTRDARRIAEEIEAVGGDLNAETGIEHTSYTVRLMKEDIKLGIEILADILLHSRFDEEELAREKNVILQEIGAVEDAPDELATDLFVETAYKQQAIGRSILGTLESVQALTRDNILSYLANHYCGPRMVLAAVGAVDHDEIVSYAREMFANLPSGGIIQPAAALYSGGELVLERDVEQTQILLGFHGCSYLDNNIYALQAFAQVLGGGMSSRLFQEVREKRGLAYSVDAFHWGFSDTGLFGMSAATAPKDVSTTVPVLIETLQKSIKNITKDEIKRAGAQLKVSYLSALESPTARAEQLARQLLSLGRILSQQEVLSMLDSVSLEDVRSVGEALIKSPPTFVILGPNTETLAEENLLHRWSVS